MINDGNAFLVTNNGTVATTTTFDRNVKDMYELVVRAWDAGEPPLYADSSIRVHIIEESAYAPVVTARRATVTTGGEQYCDGAIGQVRATDADRYDILTYDIVSSGVDLFSVRQQQGEVHVAQCIDAGRYSINVSVTDGKFIAYGDVQLDVLAIDDELADEAVVMRLQNVSPQRNNMQVNATVSDRSGLSASEKSELEQRMEERLRWFVSPEGQKDFVDWIQARGPTIQLAVTPLIGVMLMLLYIRKRMTFGEHLVFLLYTKAHLTLISLCATMLTAHKHMLSMLVLVIVVPVLYSAWTARRFYRETWFMALLRQGATHAFLMGLRS